MDPATTPDSGRKRRQLISLVLVSTLVCTAIGSAVLAGRWWRAPDPSWACGPDDTTSGCVHQVTLDLDTVETSISGVDDVWLGFGSFDVSPDGSQVVAGLHTEYPYATEARPDGGFVAIFDTATGEAVTTLFDSGDLTGNGIYTEAISYSPDGSLVAMELWVDGVSSLVMVEVDSGDTTEVLRSQSGEGLHCAQLGFSPDNRLLQCGTAVLEISTSELVERLDDETRYADRSGRTLAWTRTGATADALTPAGIGIVTDPGSEQIAIPDDDEFRETRSLSFDPAATKLVVERRRIVGWSFWSLQGPRRGRPDLMTTVYDPSSGERLGSHLHDSDSFERAWDETGTHFATIDDDLRVSIFAF